MEIYNIIKEEINKLINENFNFKEIPKDIKDLIKGYDLFMNFDWNSTADKFKDKDGNYDGTGFSNWVDNHQSEQFILKLNELISKVRKDIILKHKQNLIDKKLKYFEELIKPVLGNEVLLPALSKFEETVLMDSNATIEDIERGFKEAKNIINKEGDIELTKIEDSDIFKGGEISLPMFEKFVNKNPEYKNVFNDWKTLFYQSIDFTLEDLNTSQVISLKDMKKLYDYLINIKNTIK